MERFVTYLVNVSEAPTPLQPIYGIGERPRSTSASSPTCAATEAMAP